MKHSYLLKLLVASFTCWMFGQTLTVSAQCPGGEIPAGVAFDTTVITGSGNYSTQFKFPKIDPQTAMVTCVRLCLTITGRVTMFLENNVDQPATYNIIYRRKDTLTGTGLTSPLTSSVVAPYGPYDLEASDGVPFSGPDYIAIGPDTVLNAVSFCRTITDSADLSLFYGLDSVTYDYSIDASAVVTGSGDYLFSVATQGIVNYRLEYCTCPLTPLPSGIGAFMATKTASDKAEIRWTGYDNPGLSYHYEVELSRDGRSFTSVGSVPGNPVAGTNDYNFEYIARSNQKGRHFFRVKQVQNTGYTRFSGVKYVDLESSLFPKFSLWPNPSSGNIGIKFDNFYDGKLIFQVFNTHGQKIVEKELVAPGSSYHSITTLKSGSYWLRLTDVKSQLSSVNQLLIK